MYDMEYLFYLYNRPLASLPGAQMRGGGTGGGFYFFKETNQLLHAPFNR